MASVCFQDRVEGLLGEWEFGHSSGGPLASLGDAHVVELSGEVVASLGCMASLGGTPHRLRKPSQLTTLPDEATAPRDVETTTPPRPTNRYTSPPDEGVREQLRSSGLMQPSRSRPTFHRQRPSVPIVHSKATTKAQLASIILRKP